MFRTLLGVSLLITILAGSTSGDELYRIRIENKPGGLVQVSTNQGLTYAAVGRVKVAANARITGFAASSYAPHGTVAATAVHGIRIKTGQSAFGVGKAQRPLMFSISPWQFAQIPNGYGGHIARSSGIVTDIDTGRAVFRGLSPYVGNPVFVERDHTLLPLPEDYIPVEGEVFVITVSRLADAPSEIDFENRAGGKVTAIYPDGSSKVIAEVDRPVRGVGRYDATTFTGVGAINTNHCGVITISTAPVCPPGTKEGGPVETRGGFMIQPYYHANEQGETSPQVMVVGPKDKAKPHIEGTPPLFFGCLGLAWYAGNAAASCRAQVKIGGGDWQDPPKVVGKADDALAGVTAVRLLLPAPDRKLIAAELAREAADAAARAARSGMKPRKGIIRFSPARPPRDACVATLYVDGRAVYVSNRYPYDCTWDSTTSPNGLHSIRVEAVLADDGSPVVETQQVLVKN